MLGKERFAINNGIFWIQRWHLPVMQTIDIPALSMHAGQSICVSSVSRAVSNKVGIRESGPKPNISACKFVPVAQIDLDFRVTASDDTLIQIIRRLIATHIATGALSIKDQLIVGIV
jgi:hypothetical protein